MPGPGTVQTTAPGSAAPLRASAAFKLNRLPSLTGRSHGRGTSRVTVVDFSAVTTPHRDPVGRALADVSP